jgi:uncharacterized protein YkwD
MDIPRTLPLAGYAILAITLFSFINCAKKTVPASTTAATSDRTITGSNMENDILYYVNQHRRSIGLAPLEMNRAESSVAAQHSRDMATGRAPFGHTGVPARKKAIASQVGPLMSFGENVAYGQRSAREVVEEWLHSPGHRRNIEGNFRLTGIGLARDRQGLIYFTQVFTR